MFCWSRLSRENRMRESCLCFKPPWRRILFFLWHSPCWGMEQNFLLPNLRSGLILFCTNRLQRALFLHPVRDYRQGTGTVEGKWNCVLRLTMWILIVKCVGKSWIAEGEEKSSKVELAADSFSFSQRLDPSHQQFVSRYSGGNVHLQRHTTLTAFLLAFPSHIDPFPPLKFVTGN